MSEIKPLKFLPAGSEPLDEAVNDRPPLGAQALWWQNVAEQLREHPGEWAQVKEFNKEPPMQDGVSPLSESTVLQAKYHYRNAQLGKARAMARKIRCEPPKSNYAAYKNPWDFGYKSMQPHKYIYGSRVTEQDDQYVVWARYIGPRESSDE